MDLILHVSTQALVAAFGQVYDQQVLTLVLTGTTQAGVPIAGRDRVLIRKKGNKKS